MTLKEAKATVRKWGFTLNKNQYGKYRLCPTGASEFFAYYTMDLNDAVQTATDVIERGYDLNWQRP